MDDELKVKRDILQSNLNDLSYDLENIIVSFDELLELLRSSLVSDRDIYERAILRCKNELFNVINDNLV